MSVERYFAPDTADEALRLAGEHADASVIAGGTDAVVRTRRGTERLEGTLIAIDRIAELRGWSVDADGSLRVGALTTHAELESAPEVGAGWTALADAAALVGSPATRNTGTLGGNVINASPAMELGAPLLVLQAELELRSSAGSRVLGFEELVTGPGRTSMRSDELLTSVRVPAPAPVTGSAYVRLQYRRAMEIAIVGAGAVVTLDGDTIVEARIALTAVAPTCLRVPEAEDLLRGQPLTQEALEAAGRRAADSARPIADVRAPAEYRQAVVAVIAGRALVIAAKRARGETVPVPASDARPNTRL
jgi:CO/xanthine dehydrogenase FAD-binding subunit